MKRYLKILLQLSKMALKKLSQFRINTIGMILSTSAWSLLVIGTIFLNTRYINKVFGYTPAELMAIGAIQIIFLGVFHTLVSPNIEKISEYMNQGFLDTMLLKPIDSQFLVSLTHINLPALFRILIGISILTYFVQTGAVQYGGIPSLIGFVLSLGFGLVLVYSIWFVFGTFMVWYPQMDNLVEFLYHLNTTARYPMSFFQEFGVLFVILFGPFSMALTVPFRVFMGIANIGEVILLMIVSIVFFAFSRWFWFHALRSYTSSSV